MLTSANAKVYMSNTPVYSPHPEKVAPDGCISLIGMAGAGKTTIGSELSRLTGWPQIDSDHAIEATYGAPLQTIADCLDKEAFLDVESAIIRHLRLRRVIISTGGSAVYRKECIRYLHSLGPLVYIAVPLPVILERIAKKPNRGLAINQGQTVEDLYNERAALYALATDFTIQGGSEPAPVYAENIARWLAKKP